MLIDIAFTRSVPQILKTFEFRCKEKPYTEPGQEGDLIRSFPIAADIQLSTAVNTVRCFCLYKRPVYIPAKRLLHGDIHASVLLTAFYGINLGIVIVKM